MEIGLKESLIIYAERFPEGHPLKEIAERTLVELSKENPFGRNRGTSSVKEIKVESVKKGNRFDNLEDACSSLGLPLKSVRYSVQEALRKYGLKLV